MIKHSCPACGGEVVLKSKASIYAVCTYCKSTLLRQDQDLELYGKVSEVLDDLTPLQVGTRGQYSGHPFEILGRLRMGWDNGFWNEWYLLLDTGEEAWLAEAQGFYAICFPNTEFSPPPRNEVLFGCYVEVSSREERYEVVDIKSTVCLGSEGELPFPAPKGRQSTSIDLLGEGKKFANIEYSEFGTNFYRGEYREFDDFDFQNLRELEGW